MTVAASRDLELAWNRGTEFPNKLAGRWLMSKAMVPEEVLYDEPQNMDEIYNGRNIMSKNVEKY